MQDEQVDRLIAELAATRVSLDKAAAIIRWNRVNTIIQYVLLAAVFIMGTVGVVYYFSDRKANCERGNDLRVAVNDSFDTHAASIGVALTIVSGATPDDFNEYLDAYSQQPRPEALTPRSC